MQHCSVRTACTYAPDVTQALRQNILLLRFTSHSQWNRSSKTMNKNNNVKFTCHAASRPTVLGTMAQRTDHFILTTFDVLSLSCHIFSLLPAVSNDKAELGTDLQASVFSLLSAAWHSYPTDGAKILVNVLYSPGSLAFVQTLTLLLLGQNDERRRTCLFESSWRKKRNETENLSRHLPLQWCFSVEKKNWNVLYFFHNGSPPFSDPTVRGRFSALEFL